MSIFNTIVYNNLFNDLLLWVVASEVLDDSALTIHPVWGSLFILLWLFFMFFKINNLTSFLLIAEAAMVTVVFCYITTVPFMVQSLSADLLNILNASAMEAIVGIVIVFSYHGSWKNRKNNDIAVIETSALPYGDIFLSKKEVIFRVNCYKMQFLHFQFMRWVSFTLWNKHILVLSLIIQLLVLVIFLNTDIVDRLSSEYNIVIFNDTTFSGGFECKINKLKSISKIGNSIDNHQTAQSNTRISNQIISNSQVEISALLELIESKRINADTSVGSVKNYRNISNNSISDTLAIIENDFNTNSIGRKIYYGLGPALEGVSVLSLQPNPYRSEVLNLLVNILFESTNNNLIRTDDRHLKVADKQSQLSRGFRSNMFNSTIPNKPHRVVDKFIPISNYSFRYNQNYSNQLNINKNKLVEMQLKPTNYAYTIIRSFLTITSQVRALSTDLNHILPHDSVFQKLIVQNEIIPHLKNETFAWSDKSFVAPSRMFSHLLPWFEESSTSNEILDSSDPNTQITLYSTYSKYNTEYATNNIIDSFDIDFTDDLQAPNDVQRISEYPSLDENKLNEFFLDSKIKSARLARFSQNIIPARARDKSLFGSDLLAQTSPGLYYTKRHSVFTDLTDNYLFPPRIKKTPGIVRDCKIELSILPKRLMSYTKNYDSITTSDTLNKNLSQSIYKSRLRSRGHRTDGQIKPKKQIRLSLLRKPGTLSENTKHINSLSELSDLRSAVKSRMFKPVEDVLNAAFNNLYLESPKITDSSVPPRSSPIKSLISQTANIIHSVDSSKYPLYVSKTKYDNQIKSVKAVDSNKKISITADDETDIEMLRVFSEKPNTLYGLVWDEFISSSMGSKLMFMSFDNHYSNRSIKSNYKGIQNSGFSKIGILGLLPDLRYNFSVNDEITTHVKHNLILPLFENKKVFSKTENKGGYYRFRRRFRKLKFDLAMHKRLRKSTRYYSNRQRKYADPMPSQLRSQTPHLFKLPYHLKFFTNNDYLDYRHSNTWNNSLYRYNRKNNTEHRRFTRLDSSTPKINDISDSLSRSSNSFSYITYGFNDSDGFDSISSDSVLSPYRFSTSRLFISDTTPDDLLRGYMPNNESENLVINDALSTIRAITPGIRKRKKKTIKNKSLSTLISTLGGNRFSIHPYGHSGWSIKHGDLYVNNLINQNIVKNNRTRKFSRFNNPIIQIFRSNLVDLENSIRARNSLAIKRSLLLNNGEVSNSFSLSNSKTFDASALVNSRIFSSSTERGQARNRTDYLNSWTAQGLLPKFEYTYSNPPQSVNETDLELLNFNFFSWNTDKAEQPIVGVNSSTPSKYYRGYYSLFNSNPWTLYSGSSSVHCYCNALEITTFNVDRTMTKDFKGLLVFETIVDRFNGLFNQSAQLLIYSIADFTKKTEKFVRLCHMFPFTSVCIIKYSTIYYNIILYSFKIMYQWAYAFTYQLVECLK